MPVVRPCGVRVCGNWCAGVGGGERIVHGGGGFCVFLCASQLRRDDGAVAEVKGLFGRKVGRTSSMTCVVPRRSTVAG